MKRREWLESKLEVHRDSDGWRVSAVGVPAILAACVVGLVLILWTSQVLM